MGEFSDNVFAIVRQIPAGKVSTYGHIAALMGRPQSGRYVGFALRNNPEPFRDGEGTPCHRVLFKDGSLCKGFAFGGPDVQRELLQAEGVTFVDDTHVDLGCHLWDGRGSGTDSGGGPNRVPGQALDEAPGGKHDRPPEDFDWQAELGEEAAC